LARADVGVAGHRTTARLLDLGHDLFRLGAVDVVHDERSPFTAEMNAVPLAHAPPAAGDNPRFTFEYTHRSPRFALGLLPFGNAYKTALPRTWPGPPRARTPGARRSPPPRPRD